MTDGRHTDYAEPGDEIRRLLSEQTDFDAGDLLDAWIFAEDARPASPDRMERNRMRGFLLSRISVSNQTPVYRLKPLRTSRLFHIKAFAVAATIALLITASFIVTPTATTIRVPSGLQTASDYVLPDGSVARLSAGSVLSWSSEFGVSERRVALRGEAYFDVKKQKTPFFVDTYNARTSVLGTTFTVRSWPGSLQSDTEVRLSTGRVALAPKASLSNSVMLDPGFAASVISVPTEPRRVDIDRDFAWISGGFSFDNLPVGDALQEIERRYDIRLNAPAAIRLRRINYFKRSASGVSEVLDEITSTIGVRFRQVSGGYELFLP